MKQKTVGRRKVLALRVPKHSFVRVVICSALVPKTFQPFIEISGNDREVIKGNCTSVQRLIRANAQYN